ncbi:MAG: hypothetical protein JGK23_31730 [Microcoleus sp. PH2017_19_SFW_U_A]|nr:hypothetical protein [Microcoleus sp. PH2017_19_SFW_U_A]
MMTNLNYRLLPPKDEYVQVSIYLNRVHLDGCTPDRAIAIQNAMSLICLL